ncbi:hypothetical protein phi9181_ORF012 [Enterococcus phage 9181]|nr:hypothetical protein phi9181_ORF012 [Enterococcus phage 9181]
MDYSKWYVGDKVFYQGQTCANTVKYGEEYEVVRLVSGKPHHAFILDDLGNEKLIQMSSLFVKVGGK